MGTRVTVAGALAVAAAGFLPWGGSGRADRTSYALVAVAERLEVVSGAPAVAARAWYLAPLAAGVALVAAGGVALAVAVLRSPVLDRPGPYVTIAAAGVVGVGLVLARTERGRDGAQR